MPNTIPYQEISAGPNETPYQPIPRLVYPVQGAAWRRGDIVVNSVVGSVTSIPASAGGLAGVAGPSASQVTITSQNVSGASALTYFLVFNYDDGSGNQSLPSQEFVYNAAAGTAPHVTVLSAGAPSGATKYNVYAGLFPGGECLQNASAVNLGTASNAVTYPLTNTFGANRGATNPASTVGILGFADVASNAMFTGGYPGGSYAGPLRAFGPSGSVPPLDPPETIQIPLISLGNNFLIEINLSAATPYYPSLDGTTTGLSLDATTGFWFADPAQSHKNIHLVTAVSGAYTVNPLTGVPVGSNPGQVGDYGVRMIAYIDSTYLA